MAALTGEEPDRSAERIAGDFGAGAYGPTIILKLLSDDAARWLHELFDALASTKTEVVLTDEPGVCISGVRHFVLRRNDVPSVSGLRRTGPEDFEWSGSPQDWMTCAGLMEPFTEGRKGHQYLTTEGVDDALVEVSFGEPALHVPDGERPGS